MAINISVILDSAAQYGGVKQLRFSREGGFAGIEELLETEFIGVENQINFLI